MKVDNPNGFRSHIRVAWLVGRKKTRVTVGGASYPERIDKFGEVWAFSHEDEYGEGFYRPVPLR